MDKTREILELHYELQKTQLLLDLVVSRIDGISISKEDLELAREKALRYLQAKFAEFEIMEVIS